MRKRSIFLFVLLLIFWILISEEIDILHILVGALAAFATVWLWQDLGPKQPGVPSTRIFLHLIRCLILLVWYIIESCISVAKTLLFSNPPPSPVFVEMETHIKTNWGRTLLGTCITISPGTVTVDINPDTGRFLVHALTEESAVSLLHWRIIHEIENLEKLMQEGV
ncbi:MAG: Na+/H+ antiporter subunit E [Clostridiaceae bacterium]|nr:Na+/H+ antiporter subunit E [Clostridiaceae bacterium]